MRRQQQKQVFTFICKAFCQYFCKGFGTGLSKDIALRTKSSDSLRSYARLSTSAQTSSFNRFFYQKNSPSEALELLSKGSANWLFHLWTMIPHEFKPGFIAFCHWLTYNNKYTYIIRNLSNSCSCKRYNVISKNINH